MLQKARLGTSGLSRNSAAKGVATRVTSKLRQNRNGSTSVPEQECARHQSDLLLATCAHVPCTTACPVMP